MTTAENVSMSYMNEQLFHHRDIIDSFYYTTAYREFIQTKGTQNIILSIVSQKHVVYLPHTPDIKQETFALRKKNKITMKSEKWHPCHSILPLISSPLFLHTSPISFFDFHRFSYRSVRNTRNENNDKGRLILFSPCSTEMAIWEKDSRFLFSENET